MFVIGFIVIAVIALVVGLAVSAAEKRGPAKPSLSRSERVQQRNEERRQQATP